MFHVSWFTSFMKIKTNDNIKVLTGSDKGKIGKVIQVFPHLKKASVDGVNIRIKNLKSRKSGEKGQRISFPSPVALSNLSLVCPKCSKPARVNYKTL